MGNKITSPIKYWLKPQQKLTSSNQNPSPKPLPNDVLALILAKLDIVTLCRCNAASKPEFANILPHVRSLTTPLPPSFFLPERATLWYGKIFLYLLHNKSKFYLMKIIKWLPMPLFMYVLLFGLSLYGLMYMPRISPSGRRFFNRLKGLEFVELELPPPVSSLDYLKNPNSWFRWDGGFKTGGRSHFLFVMGDKHDENNNIENKRLILPKEEFFRKLGLAIRHTIYHVFTSDLIHKSELDFILSNFFKDKMKWFSKDDKELEQCKWMNYKSKDIGKNGRLWDEASNEPEVEEGSKSMGVVAMACYVPTTITVTNHSNKNKNKDNCDEDLVGIKNVWVLCLAYDDVNRNTDDIIKDCVGEFEQKDDVDDARLELGEAVMKILADENRRNWDDSKFWIPYN